MYRGDNLSVSFQLGCVVVCSEAHRSISVVEKMILNFVADVNVDETDALSVASSGISRDVFESVKEGLFRDFVIVSVAR